MDKITTLIVSKVHSVFKHKYFFVLVYELGIFHWNWYNAAWWQRELRIEILMHYLFICEKLIGHFCSICSILGNTSDFLIYIRTNNVTQKQINAKRCYQIIGCLFDAIKKSFRIRNYITYLLNMSKITLNIYSETDIFAMLWP